MTKEEAITILEAMPRTEEETEAVTMATDSLKDIPEGEWEYKGGHYGCTLCGHSENEPLEVCPNCLAKLTVGAR